MFEKIIGRKLCKKLPTRTYDPHTSIIISETKHILAHQKMHIKTCAI